MSNCLGATPQQFTSSPFLPQHGRIVCARCHKGQLHQFDKTQTEEHGWRITNNPLAWGGRTPEVMVLGFSKGPTQKDALAHSRHEDIAYKGGRTELAKILHHIGLLPTPDRELVDRLIADPSGHMHFGSLIRCTVERYDDAIASWVGTGGSMLDGFMRNQFGNEIAKACGEEHLSSLPAQTRMIVMLGLGRNLNYVESCFQLFQSVRPQPWIMLNEVSYTDGDVVVVHTEHFKTQGAHLSNWLSGTAHTRGSFGLQARRAVEFSKKLPLQK
jgi:hypothetical protein